MSLLLLFSLSSRAQFEQGNHVLMASYGSMQMEQDIYNEINLDYEYQVFRRMTLGYSFGIGKRVIDDQYHIHFPGGPILTGAMWTYAAPLLDGATAEGIVGAFFASLIITAIPEKVSVDFFLKNKRIKVSPFLRYLSFDYVNQSGGAFNKLFYRMGIGMDLKFLDASNRFVFGGSMSYRNILEIDHGLNLDVKIGVLINGKTPEIKKFDRLDLGYD